MKDNAVIVSYILLSILTWQFMSRLQRTFHRQLDEVSTCLGSFLLTERKLLAQTRLFATYFRPQLNIDFACSRVDDYSSPRRESHGRPSSIHNDGTRSSELGSCGSPRAVRVALPPTRISAFLIPLLHLDHHHPRQSSPLLRCISPRMASKAAHKRVRCPPRWPAVFVCMLTPWEQLNKEYVAMQREPPPFVWAVPDEKNILTCELSIPDVV
jgi:hypothetical protein